jgi:prepilin-type N-terminal cleavage/methylation domain-containing protein
MHTTNPQSFRRGVTLLECLISIFVLAIGLVSVASLVPVAGFQAARALVDDRKAMLGLTAARDFKVHGFLRPDYWLTSNSSTPIVSGTAGWSQVVNSSSGAWTSASSTSSYTLPCMAIDPLMIAKGFGTAVDNFTATNSASPSSALVMKRITSTVALGTASDQVCTSQDDLHYDFPTTDQGNPDGLPIGAYFKSGGVNTKRAYDGRFTWVATLVPVWGDPVLTVGRNEMLLSVVVFNQRNFGATGVAATAPQNATAPTERAAKVTFINGTTPASISGGDLIITDANQANVALNIGEWIMLGGMIQDLNAGSAQQRPMFRWYRVVTAAPATGSGPYQRNITVAGPDWNLKGLNGNMMAYIYDGAVAVYERTVRLEGSSIWSN